MQKRILKLLALWVVFVSLVLGLSANIWAHAALQSTIPINNQVLVSSPQNIVVTFSQRVHLLQSRLINQAGDKFELDIQNISPISDTFQLTLPHLPVDHYIFDWGIISDDGHPVTGVLQFEITG